MEKVTVTDLVLAQSGMIIISTGVLILLSTDLKRARLNVINTIRLILNDTIRVIICYGVKSHCPHFINTSN